jgi:hypothetical protein
VRARLLATLMCAACGRIAFDATGDDAGVIAATQTATTTTTGAVGSLAFPGPVQSGDTIVACFTFSSAAATLVSIDDSLADTYSVVVGPVVSNGYAHYVAIAADAAAGSNVVTVTLSADVTDSWEILALEYSGLRRTAPFDVATYDSGDGSAMSSGIVSTSSPHELLLACGHSTDPGPGSGYTVRDTAQDSLVEDQVVVATGSYAATATATPGIWTLILIGLR